MDHSIAELWNRIVESGLATAADRGDWFARLNDLSSQADAYDAAQQWIAADLLTAFQSQELLEGKETPLGLGPYVLRERLGQGGMGTVYRAWHRVMEREVAVKLIHPHRLENPDKVKRFQREVATIARLEHPKIVRAYDAGETRGVRYLVMELVDGQDLATVVRENGPMPWEEAVACITQAAQALEFAHAQGIVHRDIKPGNLLLDNQGNVKVLDLGLASRLDSDESRLTEVGQTMGTVDYIAPEQAHDAHTADARSDIYSLGMTLWTLLTDTTPYRGSFAAKLLAHQQEPAPDLAAACPEAPTWLVELYQKMVAKKPTDRFTSMGQLLAHLAKHQFSPTNSEIRSLVASGVSEAPAVTMSAGRVDVETVSLPAVESREASPKQSEPIERPPAAKRSSPTWMVLVAIAVLALVAFVVWKMFGGATDPKPGPNTPNPTTPPTVGRTSDLPVENGNAIVLFTGSENESPDVSQVALAAGSGWKLSNGKLASDENQTTCLLRTTNRVPSENYRIEAKFAREKGYDAIYFILPVRDRACLVAFNAYPEERNNATHAGVSMIDGTPLTENETDLVTKQFAAGEVQTATIDVDTTATETTIDVRLNDQPLFTWKGETTRLSLRNDFGDPRDLRPGVGSVLSRYTLVDWRYTRRK